MQLQVSKSKHGTNKGELLILKETPKYRYMCSETTCKSYILIANVFIISIYLQSSKRVLIFLSIC